MSWEAKDRKTGELMVYVEGPEITSVPVKEVRKVITALSRREEMSPEIGRYEAGYTRATRQAREDLEKLLKRCGVE